MRIELNDEHWWIGLNWKFEHAMTQGGTWRFREAFKLCLFPCVAICWETNWRDCK